MASSDPDRKEEEETTGADDEDTGAQIAPIIKLEEVAVSTGEEDENVLLDLKAKLYRFDKDGNQWKERGTGTVKLLRHIVNGKVRLVMRQNKTLKICANHLVTSSIKMQEHAGNDKSCVWHATDFSDGELKEEMFAIRFGSVENCKLFMEKVDAVAEAARDDEPNGEPNEGAADAARLIENLSVGESSSDKKVAEEAPATSGVKEKPTEEEVPATSEEKEKPSDTEGKEPSSAA